MAFQAYALALEAIRQLVPLVTAIKHHDADLAKQIRRAASSVTLNLKEGSRRRGEDRTYHYSVAAGSADEVLGGLDTSDAWGWTHGAADVRETYDHLLAILWKLVHKAPQQTQEPGQ